MAEDPIMVPHMMPHTRLTMENTTGRNQTGNGNGVFSSDIQSAPLMLATGQSRWAS